MNRTFLSLTRHLLFFVLAGLLITGCGLQKQNRLGADDHRFAAFYSDYLARTGVGSREGESLSPGMELNAAGLDSLFARHGLDRKRFDARLRIYSQNPELWRKVLEEVRTNLRSTP